MSQTKDKPAAKTDNAPVVVDPGSLPSSEVSLLWPYVLAGSFLILGIAILGMIWAVYWRLSFQCFRNGNIWCNKEYTCPGLYDIKLDSDSPPANLSYMSSQPTSINIETIPGNLLELIPKGTSGGVKPRLFYGQDLVMQFLGNRCKFGLYDNPDITDPKVSEGRQPPVLCTCLAQYSRSDATTNDDGSYTTYRASCGSLQ